MKIFRRRLAGCRWCKGSGVLPCYICDGSGDDCLLCFGGWAPCTCSVNLGGAS